MMGERLVLASASPRRADVLRQLGLDPDVCPADIDEAYLDGESPSEHVERLALEKALVVSSLEPDAWVVGGDTIVLDGSSVLGKPTDEEDAVAMLLSLSGRTHEVLSGIALIGPDVRVTATARTVVRFRTLSDDDARAYVATGEPMDKAGAYGIQGMGAALVAGIEGDFYAVMGFPVDAFMTLLERAALSYDFRTVHGRKR